MPFHFRLHFITTGGRNPGRRLCTWSIAWWYPRHRTRACWRGTSTPRRAILSYSVEETIGRNCRPEATVRDLRKGISEPTGCVVEVMNHQKTGAKFVNCLRLPLNPHLRRGSSRTTSGSRQTSPAR